MKNVIIVGVGETGSAIKRLEEENNNNIFAIDDKLPILNYNSEEIDVMHICIPFIKNFVYIVKDYIEKYKPKLVIINSTVKPGITELIKELTNVSIVHSPIRGIHPNLYEGIKTFVKFIGGTEEDRKLAQNHFESLGIKTSTMTSKESEFLKLLSTTYYGWNIAFANHVKKMCDENDLDYNNVYTKSNVSYDEGYTKLNKSNVIRPVLFPPEDGIGGHCITSNAIILNEYCPDMCNQVLEVGKDSKDKLNDLDWLYCEYITKNRTIASIAKELRVPKQNIKDRLKKYNIFREE